MKPSGYTFKFNKICLADADFNIMIKDYLQKHKREEGSSVMSHLTKVLKEMKIVVRRWERNKLKKEKARIRYILLERNRIHLEVAEGT